MVELGGNLIAEQPASATRTHSPRIDVLGVAPHQVTECTLVRNLLGSGDNPDLIDSPDLGAEAAVHTQDGSIHNGGKDEKIKYLAACFPNRSVAILRLTFLVEAINLGNLPRLVISSDEHDPIGVSEAGQSYCVSHCAVHQLTLL